MSGRTLGALFVIAALTGAAVADESVVPVPVASQYLVTATIVPGSEGAEVCGGNKGEGHVQFRIGFGPDQRLRINGVDVGPYNPEATYHVTVDCRLINGQWLATTHVLNLGTGVCVHQMDYAIAGEAQDVAAAAEEVLLCVQ